MSLKEDIERVLALSELAMDGEWRSIYLQQLSATGKPSHSLLLGPRWVAVERDVHLDEPDAALIAAAVNLIRKHGPTIAALAERLAAAEADAARYRFMRATDGTTDPQGYPRITQWALVAQDRGSGRLLFGADLDAAIDAALHPEATP